jgi:LmbE family N-acetylglucosaminyl deacetylase
MDSHRDYRPDYTGLGGYDSLYLAPHVDDVNLACAGRVLADRRRGLRVLHVVLFSDLEGRHALRPPESDAPVSSGPLGDTLLAGFPPAPVRDSGLYRSHSGLVRRRHPDDDAWVDRAALLLDRVGGRSAARSVYVPMTLGYHIDHRLAQEAALRAFHAAEGRNLYLYEERPEACTPGAVRVRLGEMGARLPPVVRGAARGAGLLRFALLFPFSALARGDARRRAERVDAAFHAVGRWWAARAWNPAKAFGPLLQPMLQETDAELLDPVRTLRNDASPLRPEDRKRYAVLERRYEASLGGAASERYWLMLPGRDAPMPVVRT